MSAEWGRCAMEITYKGVRRCVLVNGHAGWHDYPPPGPDGELQWELQIARSAYEVTHDALVELRGLLAEARQEIERLKTAVTEAEERGRRLGAIFCPTCVLKESRD